MAPSRQVLQAGDLLHRLEVGWSVTSLAFAPDSEVLLGASAGTIRSWNTESGEPIRDYAGSNGDTYSLQFAANGQTFVTNAISPLVVPLSDSAGFYRVNAGPLE